ncbi:MAG TPA: flagella basal body P-ring formation protein FlgA [Terriglobales bacterium]|jgi:hypothetical protein
MNAGWHMMRFPEVVVLLLMHAGFLVFPPRCAAAPARSRSNAKYAISQDTVRDTIAAFLKKEQSANSPSANKGSNELRDNGPDRIVVPCLADLKIPADLMAREKNPELEVTSIRRDAFAHDLLIHLRCRRREACGSFLVLASPASGIREFPSRNFSGPVPTSELSATRPAVLRRARHSAPVLVEPGKPAVLVLQGQGMRITLPVTCLERGSLDQQVSVRDPMTRKIVQAKVVGPGQLQSAF